MDEQLIEKIAEQMFEIEMDELGVERRGKRLSLSTVDHGGLLTGVRRCLAALADLGYVVTPKGAELVCANCGGTERVTDGRFCEMMEAAGVPSQTGKPETEANALESIKAFDAALGMPWKRL